MLSFNAGVILNPVHHLLLSALSMYYSAYVGCRVNPINYYVKENIVLKVAIISLSTETSTVLKAVAYLSVLARFTFNFLNFLLLSVMFDD